MYQMCMFAIAATILHTSFSIRTSPDLPDAIISSIRAGIMLPGNRLVRSKESSCDSFSGPVCEILGRSASFSAGGLLDRGIWGEMRGDVYKNMYSKLSEYAQHHWTGSGVADKRETKMTSLSKSAEGGVTLSPFEIDIEAGGFEPSFNLSSSALYLINKTVFGYISFASHAVSVAKFQVRASASSHALARAYRNGLPVWSRLVRSLSESDVARPCTSTDPSLEAIDYMEVIGEGAEIISLDLTFSDSIRQRNYVYLDEDPSSPSQYYGIRSFSPSAFLMDMDVVIKEGWVVRGDLPDRATPGNSENVFSYEYFVEKMAMTSAERFPSVQMEYFVNALESKIHESSSFHEVFANVLLDSTPDLIAFVLRLPIRVENDSYLNPFLTRLYHVKTKHTGRSDSEDPVLALIAKSVENITKMNFHRLQSASASTVASTEKLIHTLYTLLGDERFAAIAIQSKLTRLAETKQVAKDGIDEDVLADILIKGFGLPIDAATPIQIRKEIFTKFLESIAIPEIDQITDVLSQFP